MLSIRWNNKAVRGKQTTAGTSPGPVWTQIFRCLTSEQQLSLRGTHQLPHLQKQRVEPGLSRFHGNRNNSGGSYVCLYIVIVYVTLVAVVIDVNARAQWLAKHSEVKAQGGSSNPLQTHIRSWTSQNRSERVIRVFCPGAVTWDGVDEMPSILPL